MRAPRAAPIRFCSVRELGGRVGERTAGRAISLRDARQAPPRRAHAAAAPPPPGATGGAAATRNSHEKRSVIPEPVIPETCISLPRKYPRRRGQQVSCSLFVRVSAPLGEGPTWHPRSPVLRPASRASPLTVTPTHTLSLSHDTMGTHTPASRAGLLRDRPRRELLHGAARRGACSKCLPPARVVAVTRSLALD